MPSLKASIFALTTLAVVNAQQILKPSLEIYHGGFLSINDTARSINDTKVGAEVQYKCQYMAGLNFYDL